MQDNIIEVKVFVSCPGDVTEEKDMIKIVVDSVNNTLFKSKSFIRFKVLDWRDIVAKMDGRTQEQINVFFSDYDIYIGILWMRFGTPTGAINPNTYTEYQSGTEEEFRLALQRYGSGQKVNMYLFLKDPKATTNLIENYQYTKVLEFFEEVKTLGWILKIPNKSQSNDFNNKIHSILHECVYEVKTQRLINDKEAYFDQQNQNETDLTSIDPTVFIAKAKLIEPVISRTLTAFSNQKDKLEQLFQQVPDILLKNLVKDQKRIVLLGNAGSGKSIELGQLAFFYAQPDTPFVPVYQRMNVYVDEAIENFLPKGWDSIPEQNALIILDGLDEIQSQHFNTAIRKILNFSDKFPELHLVVSCRTNFYHFPENGSSGTLTGFKIYFVSDIPGNKLHGYADRYFNVNVKAFIIAAHEGGFLELSKQPFFLNLLLKQFQIHNNLKVDRVEIMDLFIQERISLDQSHFEHTTNLKDNKEYILNLLKRVSLIMEAMGRNFVTYEELRCIVPKSEDFELLKYATAFQAFGTGTWGFDHNNIQEYLAASALIKFKISKIKEFLSFKNERIKPSWLNTLFFLMSIIPEKQRKLLIDWMLSIEPEVLVKIEADKVDEATRLTIFKQIFEYYKVQKVWLRSNKFTEKELAIFAPQQLGAEYLLKELINTENLRIIRLNALRIFRYMELKGEMLEKAKTGIKMFMEELIFDGYAVFNAIHTLEGLGLANQNTINYLLELFGERGDQYIRAAIYSIIITAGLVNDYIDYFIAGALFEFDQSDRSKVNLMDEGMMLREGLGSPTSYEALKKVLKIFNDPFNRKITNFYEKHLVFQKILDNARIIASSHSDIVEDIYQIYAAYGRASEETMASCISTFFKQIDQGEEIFKRLFYDTKIGAYEKGLLIQPLLTSEMTDYIVRQYEEHNVTNKDLLNFYNNITWSRFKDKYESELNYLTDQLNNKTQALVDLPEIDYAKLRRLRDQSSFDLYFSVSAFKEALKSFFKEIGREEVNWDQLWQIAHYGLNEKFILPGAIFDLLSDFTRRKEIVTLELANRFIERESDFEKYRYNQIQNKIENMSGLIVTSEQQNVIEHWVKSTLLSTDIVSAIKFSEENPNYFNYSGLVVCLWYFIKRYSIMADEQKLLDFTMFDERKNTENQGLDFEIIERLVGTKKLHQRVLKNIKNGIAFDRAWRNNALYAISNGITEAEISILQDLIDPRKSSYLRAPVLNAFAELPDSAVRLMSLLPIIDTYDLKWKIVDLINDRQEVQEDLIKYLKDILEKDHHQSDQKFRASRYLTEKGIIEGTNFYIIFLLNYAGPDFDFYHEAVYLRLIKDINLLPELLLLLKKANSEEYSGDAFNRFDSIVSDALFNLAIISADNLFLVKTQLLKFIEENTGKIENVNFLLPMIDRMEYSYYLSQTQNRTVYEAVAEVDSLLITE